MKTASIIASSCLWLVAIAWPARTIPSPSSQITAAPSFDHRISPISPHLEDGAELIKARTPKGLVRQEATSHTPSTTTLTVTSTLSPTATSTIHSTVTHFSSTGPQSTSSNINNNGTSTSTIAPTTSGGLTTYCNSNGSTFIDATIPESPPVGDCAGIADQLSRGGANVSTWTYDHTDLAHRNTTGMKQLYRNGACAFGIVAGELRRAKTVRVGTGDVVALVREAVRRFGGAGANATAPATAGKNGTEGKLDVAGAFACDDKNTMLNWALYHA